MTICLARDLVQWTQLVGYPYVKWRRLAFSLYFVVNPSPNSIFSPVEFRRVKTSNENFDDVPFNRLRECLSPMSVFAFINRFFQVSDASRFRHRMRDSGHLTEV